MIFVSVANDKTEIKRFFNDIELSADSIFLLAKEEDDAVGCAAFTIEDGCARIAAVEYNDLFTCELLLRSVANYAERRWINKMTADFTEPAQILAAVGFRLIDGRMTGFVSNVVHMCKNCGEDGE